MTPPRRDKFYEFIVAQPVPMKLAVALADAPVLRANQTPARIVKAKGWGVGSLNADDLTPPLRRTLLLVAHGYSDPEIAARTYYALDSVKDQVKALCAVFMARNRTHLSALAVAQGYVDMTVSIRAPS